MSRAPLHETGAVIEPEAGHDITSSEVIALLDACATAAAHRTPHTPPDGTAAPTKSRPESTIDRALRERLSLDAGGPVALIEHPGNPAIRFETIGECAAPALPPLEQRRQEADAAKDHPPAAPDRRRRRGGPKLLALATALFALAAWAAIALIGTGHATGPAAPGHAAPRTPRVTPLPNLAQASTRLTSRHAIGGVSHHVAQRPHGATTSTGAHPPPPAAATPAAAVATPDRPVSVPPAITHAGHPRLPTSTAPAPGDVDRHTPVTSSLPRRKSSTSIAHPPGAVDRRIPVASSLPPCGDALNGPPRDCRNLHGGFEAIADRGTPLHMRTLDARITSVTITRSLARGGATAPPGISLIVIGATITNRTATPQVFEPAAQTVPGRQTGLWIYGQNHQTLPYHGPDFADYSVQVQSAFKFLSQPLSGATLRPGIPYHGQLVFAYPEKELQHGAVAVLDIQEFGEGFGSLSSIGGFRIRL